MEFRKAKPWLASASRCCHVPSLGLGALTAYNCEQLGAVRNEVPRKVVHMRQSLFLRQQLRDSIKSEIAERTKVHQAKIAALKTGRAITLAAGAPPSPDPLVVLANGDSWFDYPLDGNALSLTNTDIVAHLESMGNINPVIQNVAHFGDATTAEMSWPKQYRMIQSLQEKANWLNGIGPDAILFSGGGNDIAGDQFCIFLDYAGPGANGLNAARFQGMVDMVEASYYDLFAFRDRYAPGVPVFSHCYDFPIPNGAHPGCAGPWLQPSLSFAGWNVTQGTTILRQALTDFRMMLLGLANNPDYKFILVDTQGTLVTADWANELHPYRGGFQKIASKFVDALRAHFPGRI
jgi:hypothetical protein